MGAAGIRCILIMSERVMKWAFTAVTLTTGVLQLSDRIKSARKQK